MCVCVFLLQLHTLYLRQEAESIVLAIMFSVHTRATSTVPLVHIFPNVKSRFPFTSAAHTHTLAGRHAYTLAHVSAHAMYLFYVGIISVERFSRMSIFECL